MDTGYIYGCEGSRNLYLVRVPGNDRRYVHANHLIPADARGMSAHKEIVTPEMVEHNPPLDFQREPVVAETRLRIHDQSEVDNEISPKSSVIAVPVIDDRSNVESGNNSGLRSPDQVRLPNLPCLVTLSPDMSSGYAFRTGGQSSRQIRFIVFLCKLHCMGRRKCGILGSVNDIRNKSYMNCGNEMKMKK